jgi:hypothetical protein
LNRGSAATLIEKRVATVARDFVRQFGIRCRAGWPKVQRELRGRADEKIDRQGAGPLATGGARDALSLTHVDA